MYIISCGERRQMMTRPLFDDSVKEKELSARCFMRMYRELPTGRKQVLRKREGLQGIGVLQKSVKRPAEERLPLPIIRMILRKRCFITW